MLPKLRSPTYQRVWKKLQNVPLQAPREILAELMTENYGAYIAKALLAQWIDDPSRALGRRGSSPWPDRIECKTIQRVNRDQFVVTGEICKITIVPQEKWRKEVTFIVPKRETEWLITGITQ